MNSTLEKALEYVSHYILPILALCISFVALFIALGHSDSIQQAQTGGAEAKEIAEEAKQLALTANEIAQNAHQDSPESPVATSDDTVPLNASAPVIEPVEIDDIEDVYDEIYDDFEYTQLIYQHLKPKVPTEQTKTLERFVDVFDRVGNGYCQGGYAESDIRSYLGRTLRHVCTNADIATYFAQGKNGLAILCDQFVPDSRYSQKLVPGTLDACEFASE